MEFRDVVRRRRMVRNYEDLPVDEAAIDRILQAGTRAPSAGFSQGTRLIVVTDGDTRHEIAQLADEEHYVAQGFVPWMSRAPVHVIVCVRENDYHERYREPDKLQDDGTEIAWPVPYWWVDAGASLMLILLAAVDEGLAAGFFGFHRIGAVKALLGIPDDVAPIGIVTIGQPAPDRRSSSLDRGKKPGVVHRERWS
jgi:nitroreductase